MRLDLHLDTDPAGTGQRARWWAVVLGFAAVILLEVLVLTALLAVTIDLV